MKKIVIAFLCFSVFANQAYALAPPAIGAELANVLKYKALARGIAANDPRFGATVGAVGAAITEIATGVAIAGTAPAWGTILASAVIAGVVGYGLSALTGWLFNKDGTVNVPGTSSDHGISAGSGVYIIQVPSTGALLYGGDPFALIAQMFIIWELGAEYSNVQPSPNSCTGAYGANIRCFFQATSNSTGQVIGLGYAAASWYTGPVPSACPSGSFYNGASCVPYTQPTGSPASTKPVGDALTGLSDAEKAKPLPAKVVADMADAAYRMAASKPDYAGIPYSLTDPVTETDVQAARAANPSTQIATLGDLAQPMPATDPLGRLSDPTATTGTNPAVTQPQVNLGTDPVIGSPTLEATPTAQQIIDPLVGIAPSLKNWMVPSHQAQCPVPAFDLFGRHIVMDQQCSMFEDNRAALYNAMLVAWVMIALFIVLSA